MSYYEIKTPVTGNVSKIFVKKEEIISKGEKIAVLESMKMEIPIESDKGGVIKNVMISEGDSVSDGDTLISLE